MSSIKCLSVVASMVTVAVALIFGNSFLNALSISSFENKSRLYYASPSANKVVNFTSSSCHSILRGNVSGVTNSNNKVIMLGFDDGWKGQITFAKPILDKYGFKASFFVVCDYVNSGGIRRMNWQDIADYVIYSK